MRWALEIAQALCYLHSFKPMIVHRDLKLENILLTSPYPGRAHAKLADFGLHKMIKVLSLGSGGSWSGTGNLSLLQSTLSDVHFLLRTTCRTGSAFQVWHT